MINALPGPFYGLAGTSQIMAARREKTSDNGLVLFRERMRAEGPAEDEHKALRVRRLDESALRVIEHETLPRLVVGREDVNNRQPALWCARSVARPEDQNWRSMGGFKEPAIVGEC